MTAAAAAEGHRAKKRLLAQGLAPQQQLQQGEECPNTAAGHWMDQDLLTTQARGERLRLAWAR